MIKLLIPVSVLMFTLNGFITRLFQTKFPDQKIYIRLYQGLFSLAASISFFAFSGFDFVFNKAILIYGISFGCLFAIAVYTGALGYEKGSMSLTSIISNMSLLLPIIYSCVFLSEKVSVLQYVGVALIFVTLFLSAFSGDGEKKRVSVLWIVIVLIALFSNGITAIIQKKYVLEYTDETLMQFMAIAYLTSFLIFTVSFVFKRAGSDCQHYSSKMILMLVFLSIVSGVGSFGGNALLGKLCTEVSGAVLYPCINGGLCVMTALISFIFFKEKPTKIKLSAILTGICAIVILNL